LKVAITEMYSRIHCELAVDSLDPRNNFCEQLV